MSWHLSSNCVTILCVCVQQHLLIELQIHIFINSFDFDRQLVDEEHLKITREVLNKLKFTFLHTSRLSNIDIALHLENLSHFLLPTP